MPFCRTLKNTVFFLYVPPLPPSDPELLPGRDPAVCASSPSLVGLAMTPWFIRFLRNNKLGKQLRVETVDGREASIFRKYHEKKFGTPTMGGVLIWGSIVLTVLFSRALALGGVVENSLLQRGQVICRCSCFWLSASWVASMII